jgi:acetyl-CoA C-acetyltransferase
MNKVYISSAGLAKFGRREESLDALAIESFQNMIASDTECSPEKIDAMFFGNMSAEEFTGISNISTWVTDQLGLSGLPSIRIETGSSSGAAAFQAGYYAVASGCFENVLVSASEKMTHLSTTQATKILAEVIDPMERSYGCTMTALAAMVTRKYMADYGLTKEELALIPVKNHANGALNQFAHFQKPVDITKVMNSKVISSPLRLFDCSPLSDGSAAIILTSKPGSVLVSGMGQGTDHVAVQNRASLTSFSATRLAAKRAFEMSGYKPDDIDVAEVHDAFSSFELINTEDLGFFPPGEGRKALIDGQTGLKGTLPINPSGGLKARGHPVGVSGLAQVVEIFWQLRGEAGARQVNGAKVGLTQSIGGFASNNLVNILEAV